MRRIFIILSMLLITTNIQASQRAILVDNNEATLGTSANPIHVSGQGSVGVGSYKYVNVATDYNADCTGATLANTAFQNAANYAHSNPGVGIFIPPGCTLLLDNNSGTYHTSSEVSGATLHGGVRLYGDNLVIWGYGANIITPSNLSQSGTIFYADNTGNNGITILGLTATGQRTNWAGYTVGNAYSTNTVGPEIGFFLAYDTNNITIRDNYINYFSAAAFTIDGDSTAMVNNVQIDDNIVTESSEAYPDYQHTSTNGNEVLSESITAINVSVVLYEVTNFTFTNNLINRSWADNFIATNCTYGIVSNNNINNSKMGGLVFIGDSHMTVVGNTINEPESTDREDTKLWTVVKGGGAVGNVTMKGQAPELTKGHTWVLTICATGTPDTFSVTKDGGTASTCYPITSSTNRMVIDNADPWMGVVWAATSGHSVGNTWTIGVLTYPRGSRGITIESDSYDSYTGNMIDSMGRDGVWINQNSHDITMTGNVFQINGRKSETPAWQNQKVASADNVSIWDVTATTSDTGIKNIEFTGNTVISDATDKVGIKISGSLMGGIHLTHNHVINASTGGPTKAGIYLDDRVYDTTTTHWYRCIQAYTSPGDGTDEPGVGASWTTYWVQDDTGLSSPDATPIRTWQLGPNGSNSTQLYYKQENRTVNKPMISSLNSENSTDYGASFIHINQADGNVGIGSFSPIQVLDVNGTVRATAFISSNNVGIGSTTPGQILDEATTAGNGVRFVGIGTTVPQQVCITNGKIGYFNGAWGSSCTTP